MKRTKLLLSAIVSLLLSFVMVFAVACGGNNGGNDNGSNQGSVRPAPEVPDKPAGDLGITEGPEGEVRSLLGITISTLPRTSYSMNQEFTSAGLVVRATYLDSTIAPDPLNPEANLVTETIPAANYTVDSSDFDNTRVGVYSIYVSYTYLGVTRTASYQVTVNAEDPAYGGIIAELVGEDTYTLTDSNPSVEIPKNIIAVYAVEEDGSKAENPLAADAYNADLYLGSKKMDGNVATENGVYSFVATLKADESKQDFVPVYVVNPVAKIELDATANSKFEQTKSLKDEISGTWQFTVTYANGVTKTVKSGDAGLTIAIDTNTVGNGTAKVTYVEADGAGVERTVTCEVAYTIKSQQSGGGPAVTNNYSLNIAELVAAMETRLGAAPADKAQLAAEDFTGSNAFLTFIEEGKGTADQYRTNNGGLIEIKGDRLQVTFEGTGTITVSFASTGGSNESHFGLKDANGNYVEAASTTATLVEGGDDAGTYSVTGTSAVTVTYEITEAGTYTLCSPAGVTNRGCRISAISMIDTVGGGAAVTNNYSMSISELVAAMETRLGAAPADKAQLAAEDFTGSNAFLTFIEEGKGTADQYRTSNGGLIEIKGDRLQVTFEGTGTITVSFASTGGSNESHFGLKDANGNYVEAASTTATLLTDGDDAGAYTVTGTSAVTVTYEITEAGTYTLCSPAGVTNRGCRISAISMIDTIGNGGGSAVVPEAITVTSDDATGYPDDGVYTEATAWGDSGILTILPDCKVNSSKKTVDGEDIQNRLQTAGGATTSKKSIEIDLTEYQGYVANIQVVFYVGSADTRYLKVLDSTGAEYTTGTMPTESRETSAQLIETVTLQGGAKYYLGGSNGINIYKIVITFEAV